MSRNINLVLKEGAEGLKYKRRLKRFRLLAAGLLLAVLLVSLSIYLLINFIFGTSSIEKDKDELANQLLPLRDKEAKLKVINDRLNNITLVQGRKIDVYKIVDKFLSEVPIGLSVDNLEYEMDKVSVKVSSDSLVAVDEFINNLISLAERKELVGTLILNSLVVGEIGKYEVTLNVGLI